MDDEHHASALVQLRDRRLGGVKDAGQVDADDLIPAAGIEVADGRHRAQHARIGHHRGDRAQLALGLFGGVGDPAQSPTSAASAVASPPVDLIEAANRSTAPRSMSKQATFAPACASRCAWRAPMPLPAPVTHATRPCMCSGVLTAANSMPAVTGARAQPAPNGVATVSAPTEHPPAANRATVGVIGAGNALWAYLAAIDRLAARGLARPGRICARNRSAWEPILDKRPDDTSSAMRPRCWNPTPTWWW